MTKPNGLTRRALLYGGAGAGVVAATALRPPVAGALMPALATGHLSRSAYDGLEGASFSVQTGARPVLLRLEAISDVASRPSLAGSEDAFALTFSGPLDSPLDSGIHTLHHPALGSFELFSSPVDAPSDQRHYEVVVDRSVGASKARAQAPPPPPPQEAAPEPPPAPKVVDPEPPAAFLRKASLRRAGRWARCEVVLLRTAEAERVRVKLLHRGKLVASAARDVADGRAVMRLEATKPLRAGAYTLVVTAVEADGSKRSERRRVSLRAPSSRVG